MKLLINLFACCFVKKGTVLCRFICRFLVFMEEQFCIEDIFKSVTVLRSLIGHFCGWCLFLYYVFLFRNFIQLFPGFGFFFLECWSKCDWTLFASNALHINKMPFLMFTQKKKLKKKSSFSLILLNCTLNLNNFDDR